MKLSPEDPRLTAYVLEELDPDEQAAVNRALQEDATLRAEAEELCATGKAVLEALQQPAPAGLSPEQNAAVEAALTGSTYDQAQEEDLSLAVLDEAESADEAPPPEVIIAPSFWRRWGGPLAGLAASLLIGWVFWPKPGVPMAFAKRKALHASDPANRATPTPPPARPAAPTGPTSPPDLVAPGGSPPPQPSSQPSSQPPGSASTPEATSAVPPPRSAPPAMERLMMERYGLLPGPSDPQALAESPTESSVRLLPRYGLPESNRPYRPWGEGPPPANERYPRLPPSPFLTVREHPLSTFGLEVDTASYSIVRRHIAAGHKPPVDAVRIEEMINYFPYDYPPPRRGLPLAVHLEVGGCPWAEGHRLVRIGVKAREVQATRRPACNLVFLIDVSGSMSPANKLPLVRNALLMLLERLQEEDRVAIVTYATGARLVLPSTRAQRKFRIRTVIERLQAGGNTFGSAGIRLAYEQARLGFLEGGVNRVILCTDGDFNVGVTDPAGLTRLIEEEARDGVYLTALGVGDGNYRDTTLEALAQHGNGHYAYLDRLTEAYKVLVHEIRSTLIPVAQDVKLQVEFNPAQAGAYRLLGYADRRLRSQDFNDDTKDAGELGAGHTVTAFYEIIPAGQPLPPGPGVDPLKYQPAAGAKPFREPVTEPASAKGASEELLTVKLRWKTPGAGGSQRREFPLVDTGRSFDETSTDFRFGTAVAGYGMILADYPARGDLDLNQVLRIALGNLGGDPEGYRTDFVQLVRATQRLGAFRPPPAGPVF